MLTVHCILAHAHAQQQVSCLYGLPFHMELTEYEKNPILASNEGTAQMGMFNITSLSTGLGGLYPNFLQSFPKRSDWTL